MPTAENKFGKLRLSVQGTNNGSGFDIFYDFGKAHNFAEFTSKHEFYFIQPWMQFPAKEYSDTCKLVSIELVKRFNQYDALVKENERLLEYIETLKNRINHYEDNSSLEENKTAIKKN